MGMHKARRNLLFLDSEHQHYQTVTEELAKGHLLPCKRASFALQKGTFYHAKGHLLEGERRPFKIKKRIYFTTDRTESRKRGQIYET